jgi:diguanylate cyclase (GGDEF)-like protein
MNLPEITIVNGIGIMMMVMLRISARHSFARVDFAGRIFHSLIWATMILCALETASFYIDGKSFPMGRPLNLLLNALLFLFNAAFSFSWTMYVDYKLFGSAERIRRIYPRLFIPAAAVIVMSLLNLFVPLLFSVSQDNVYSRRPLNALTYLVSFFYLIYGEILIYRNQKKADRYLFLPSIGFILPLFAGTIIQFLFYGISTIWISLAVSLTFLYINVQSAYSSIDALSGLYTRQYLDHYLGQRSNLTSGDRVTAGIMMDLDRFKEINDSCGHLAGDRAIREVGEILRTCAGRSDICARYGGDEFVILKAVRKEDEIRGTIDRIEDRIRAFNAAAAEPYRLSISYGCALFDPDTDDEDSFLRKIDEAMYLNKRKKSEKLPDRRNNRR